MKTVPEIISTKDLAYIADAFEWNFTACKKALNHSEYVQDKDIKKELAKLSKMNQKICNSLLSLLN